MFGSPSSLTSLPLFGAPVCQTFDRLAKMVWSTLADASRFHMAYGEESLTDQVLLELARSHPCEIAIRKFTKHEEGTRTGADWEWWFGDRTSWFGMRVQAKVLDAQSLRYASLSHRVRKSKKLQADLLLQDARKHDLFPLYCLYNYWTPDSVVFPWSCGSRPQAPDLLGCALAEEACTEVPADNGRNGGTASPRTSPCLHLSSKRASRCSRVPMVDDSAAFRSAFRYGRISFASLRTAATSLIAWRL